MRSKRLLTEPHLSSRRSTITTKPTSDSCTLRLQHNPKFKTQR